MPQPPLTLFPWLHLFFLGPTQNLTSVLSLCTLLFCNKANPVYLCLLSQRRQAVLPGHRQPHPNGSAGGIPYPTTGQTGPHPSPGSPTLKCSVLLSSWLHMSYSFWDLGCKYMDLHLAELGQTDQSGPQIPQSLADTVVPTGTQRSAAQHYSYLCEEQ